MKKFLIVLSCVAFLFPVVALSSSADELTVASFDPDIFSYAHININGEAYYDSPTLSTDVIYSISCSNERPKYFPLLCYVDDVLTPLSSDFSSPTELSGSVYFTIDFAPSDFEITYYFILVSPPPPDPYQELGIDDGVSAAIGFTGSVLNFITGPRVIIFVVLSIATTAIIPFAIRKIKKSIKGY